MAPRYWTPLRKANRVTRPEELVKHTMSFYNLSREHAERLLDTEVDRSEYWINDLYQVQLQHTDNGMVHLCIRRRDGAHDIRDWRHFQEIKNQLLGAECEAIELYPAESRKVDTTNKFHLYGVPDPSFRFPVGMPKRDVSYDSGKAPGLRQRPL